MNKHSTTNVLSNFTMLVQPVNEDVQGNGRQGEEEFRVGGNGQAREKDHNDAIVNKALARLPKDRYATGRELQLAIESFAQV